MKGTLTGYQMKLAASAATSFVQRSFAAVSVARGNLAQPHTGHMHTPRNTMQANMCSSFI